ncbi:PhyH-domain-containing protein [Lindgomyces ingoldianus]|uniref:PhyH-domain-containing protein n=1 Tax=Lindgomyces ingoldianus TaxID=673940 RepID=A0ACB6QS70_9PLEO|nr:PhyH-domain-containing protein [Lindgomyces ingoldianus]KAF2469418.1 PhyH-domain-containing protein [Lindgomyces ingoldianus]
MAPGLLVNNSTESDRFRLDQSSQPKVSRSPKIGEVDCMAYEQQKDLIGDIVEKLKASGGCLIRGLYHQKTLDAIEEEIRPYIAATDKADISREDFVPSSTRMIRRLTRPQQHGSQSRTSVSLPQLSTTVAFSVGPGTKAQGLHRDDDIYHTQHPASSKYHLGQDTMLCLFVAVKSCTNENGATRIVPGSHLWDYTSPPPSYETLPEQFSHAEMSPGDAFLMLGGVYHRAGSNTTADEERLRQEENQYLANDLEGIKELPIHLQKFAGFGASKPYMGWVDMEEPVKVLNRNADVGDTEFW